jgi:hypothetical protein
MTISKGPKYRIIYKVKHKDGECSQVPWLMPVILNTKKAEIRRITVQSQPEQIAHETLSRKHPSQKRAGGVAQVGRSPD